MFRVAKTTAKSNTTRDDSISAQGNEGARTTEILGVPVSIVNLDEATDIICEWSKHDVAHLVCIRDVHGIMQAQRDATFRAIHFNAGLVTPDGMPLVWVLRWRGYKAVNRVCGSDLVDAVCEASIKRGIRHYFLGGGPGVAQEMAKRLEEKYPGLIVAGCHTPPYRVLTAEEDEALTDLIRRAQPHIVWIGLSTPKQEYWMSLHLGRIPGATLIGVGAAFDFHAGRIARAPLWMQKGGLEWLHRLGSEPRRLWRRYLVLAPLFLWKLATERLPTSKNIHPE